MTAAFFNAVRANPFGGSLSLKQVDGITAIREAWEAFGDGDSRKLAYILGTAFHETARTMQPITEYGSKAYLTGKKYWPYIGRGYVQLTWRENYADWGKRLGVDLVGKPDLALRPGYAARILIQGMMLGTFTGKKLADYITPQKVDFVNARRIVNGTDKAALIAGYASAFLDALRILPAPVPAPPPPVPPEVVPAPPEPTAAASKPVATPLTIGAALAALAAAVGAYFANLWEWF